MEEKKRSEEKKLKAKERNYKRAARRWNGRIKAAGEEIKKLSIINKNEFEEEYHHTQMDTTQNIEWNNLFPPNNNNKFIKTSTITKQQYIPTPIEILNKNNNNNNEYRPKPLLPSTTTTKSYVPTPIPQPMIEQSNENNDKNKNDDLEELFNEIENMECDPEDLKKIRIELDSLIESTKKPRVLKIEQVNKVLPEGPWIRKHNKTKVPTNK